MLDPDQLKSERDLELLEFIVDRVNVGVFIVNSDMEILLWNRFMHIHSNKSESDVIGKNLFDCFHELPQKWFEKKINEAQTKAYELCQQINWQHVYYRKDIGYRAVAREQADN